MKNPISISDIVFFMVAVTLCIMTVMWKVSSEQFLTVVSMVFSAFYVHKAQNKIVPPPQNSSLKSQENK